MTSLPPTYTATADIKDPSRVADPVDEEDKTMKRPSITRKYLARFLAIVLLCYFGIQPLLSFIVPAGLFHWPGRHSHHSHHPHHKTPEVIQHALVPLEAHIMSKCPDAKDCLELMVLPTMQKVMDKVNFTLSFIGTPTDNDGVDCKHGPEECMGNIVELCAAKLYPSPKTYLGFTMCLTKDFQFIPQRSLIEDCALEHGLDFAELNKCTLEDNGGAGVGMLRDSVRRSIAAGVARSCTVRLNEEIYCIRDGGEWKDCPSGPGVNDLVIAIEKQYRTGSSAEGISPSTAR